MIPFLDVSHLPSSASFYSAVLQSLGIYYISTDADILTAGENVDSATTVTTSKTSSASTKLPPTVIYGTSYPPTPVFQIREIRKVRSSLEPLKLSRIVFSASSPAAVTDFHSFALRAKSAPTPATAVAAAAAEASPATISQQSRDIHRATVTDLDGNVMEVIYQPLPNYPSSYAGSTVRKAQATYEEVGRILDWDYHVATSMSPRSALGSAAAGPSTSALAMSAPSGQLSANEPYTLLHRSVTTSVTESPSVNKNTQTNSLATSTIVGSLLGAAVGAAAGAALTYGIMSKEHASAPRQEFDCAASAPPFQRRATFPEQYPDSRAVSGPYVEVERTVEKIRYPEHSPVLLDDRARPQHMAKYSRVGPRPHELEDLCDDGRSRHSSRYQLERGSNILSGGQADVPRPDMLMLTEHEHQSNAGSRYSVARKSAAPLSTGLDVEGCETGSYVSALSARSRSTIRPPPPTVETELAVRSKAPSRAPTRVSSVVASRAPSMAPSRVPTVARSRAPTAAPSRAPSKAPTRAPTCVPNKAPGKSPSAAIRVPKSTPVFAYPPATRAPTLISARNVSAPRSSVGSSQAAWEDDAISVVPSDSISCIGSRTSRRQYN